jgi:hypothetical protein
MTSSRAKELAPRENSSPKSRPFHAQRRSSPTPPGPTTNADRWGYATRTRWRCQLSRYSEMITLDDMSRQAATPAVLACLIIFVANRDDFATARATCHGVEAGSDLLRTDTLQSDYGIGRRDHLSIESSPCPRAKPSVRADHRVSWSGCRRPLQWLSGFKGAVIFEKIRDADCSE